MSDPVPSMIVQPYPLWCVEASRENGIVTGRVIGWVPGEGGGNINRNGVVMDYLPVLASHERETGLLVSLCEPMQYEALFVGDDRAEVERQARRWLHSQGVDGAESESPTALLDAALHSVWLHGSWRFLTSKMSTEEREAAADAVDRHCAARDAADPDDALGPVDPAVLRWWR